MSERTFIIRIVLWFMIVLHPTLSHAVDFCAQYSNYVPLPEWYDEYCKGRGVKGKIGGAFSSFADSFNLNPASIPIGALPLGVEYIASARTKGDRTSKSNLALIKGYKKIGLGFSTEGDDTFYSNSNLSPFSGTNPQDYIGVIASPGPLAKTFNFSLALPVYTRGKNDVNGGLSIRYNKTTGKFDPGVGVSFHLPYITAGFSLIKQVETQTSSEMNFYTITGGCKLLFLQVEYVYLQNTTEFLILDPVHIVTAAGNVAGFLLTGAWRKSNDRDHRAKSQYHFAVQYPFSRHFSAGYFYNYIPGFQSLALQVLF